MRSEDVEPGEDVLVAGYPYGELFSDTIKATKGIVCAIRGMGDDNGQFQMGAAVQAANSGGPIHDENGNIISVVDAQLNKIKFAKNAGSMSENVNFGIKAFTVRRLLTSAGLPTKWSNRSQRKSTKELARIARNQMVMVVCNLRECADSTFLQIPVRLYSRDTRTANLKVLFSMKNLTTTLCLTAALLLGSGGMSWSADFQRGNAALQSGDYATALREFRPLAEQGDTSAQYKMGQIYAKGEGVPQDYKKAVKWYRLAAEQGHASAQFNLGLRYYKGQGVIQDNVYAHMWWNIAASPENKSAVKTSGFLAELMTPSQLEKAQDLARECVRKKYKGC